MITDSKLKRVKPEEEIEGKFLIRFLGDENINESPKVVYVICYSENMSAYITPELNGNVYTYTSKENLYEFEFDIFYSLKKEWEAEYYQRKANEVNKAIKDIQKKNGIEVYGTYKL